MPSRSVRPASAFGIATRIVRTVTGRSIKKNARESKRFLVNEEESSISEKSWMLGLFPTCPRGRSATSACNHCRFMQDYNRSVYAVAKLSAAVATISTR